MKLRFMFYVLFLGFLLMHHLPLSMQNPDVGEPRFDRRLKSKRPSPPTPKSGRANRQDAPAAPPTPTYMIYDPPPPRPPVLFHPPPLRPPVLFSLSPPPPPPPCKNWSYGIMSFGCMFDFYVLSQLWLVCFALLNSQ